MMLCRECSRSQHTHTHTHRLCTDCETFFASTNTHQHQQYHSVSINIFYTKNYRQSGNVCFFCECSILWSHTLVVSCLLYVLIWFYCDTFRIDWFCQTNNMTGQSCVVPREPLHMKNKYCKRSKFLNQIIEIEFHGHHMMMFIGILAMLVWIWLLSVEINFNLRQWETIRTI